MSKASRRLKRDRSLLAEPGFLIALALALILASAIAAITVRAAGRSGPVWAAFKQMGS